MAVDAPHAPVVTADEAGMRLDRWLGARFPHLGFVQAQRLLRTGQVRVNGARARGARRLAPGEVIRVPPGVAAAVQSTPSAPRLSAATVAEVRSWVLHRDDRLIALNKPPGLATQGGAGTARHVDGLLDTLRPDPARPEKSERPRLVHRLDRDTSGVLALARTRGAAARLAAMFRAGTARKVYWAVTDRVPAPSAGRITLPLRRSGTRGAVPDPEEGRPAVTDYRVLDRAGRARALVALAPRTGRTHQIRAHLAALNAPVLGDGKYGPAADGGRVSAEQRRLPLHLHARSLWIPDAVWDDAPRRAREGRGLLITAPLPPHMRDTMAHAGLSPGAWADEDPFAEVW